jgi:hypothetical protein
MVYLAGFLSRRESGDVGALYLWPELGILQARVF